MRRLVLENGGGARVGYLSPSVGDDGFEHSLDDPDGHLELVGVQPFAREHRRARGQDVRGNRPQPFQALGDRVVAPQDAQLDRHRFVSLRAELERGQDLAHTATNRNQAARPSCGCKVGVSGGASGGNEQRRRKN